MALCFSDGILMQFLLCIYLFCAGVHSFETALCVFVFSWLQLDFSLILKPLIDTAIPLQAWSDS